MSTTKRNDEVTSGGDDSESEIVGLLHSGDESALELILKAYGPRVCQGLRSRFPDALSEFDLDEVMSTALLRLWTNRSRFDPAKGRLGTWFYLITRNTAIDLLRRRNRQAAVRSLEGVTDDQVRAAPDRLTEAPQTIQFRRRLHQAIGQLKEDEQAILQAYIYHDGQGDWTAAVAEKLGMTGNHVRVKNTRLLKKLRKQLTASEDSAELRS